MGRFRRLLALSIAIVLVLGAGAALSLRAGLFEIREMPVEVFAEPDARGLTKSIVDQTNLDARAVQRLRERVAARLKPYLGRKIWETDLGAMRAAIGSDEWVRSVRLSRSFPNLIRVAVSAKTPELLLVAADGRLRPIADDGSLLTAISPTILPDVPIVRGLGLAENLTLRQKAVEFARELPVRGPLAKRNIAEIVYSVDDGYSLALSSSKSEVRLGTEKLPLKMARASQVLEYLNANKLKGRVIDASFSKKVLVRLRKGS